MTISILIRIAAQFDNADPKIQSSSVMENHGYDQIIGSPDAPFLNHLAAGHGLATNYVSVAHPSLPNYLALTGGDTFGVTTDCTDCFQDAPNLAVDRVAPSGRTWRAYMESLWGALKLPDSPSIRMDVWKGKVIASTEEELLSRIQR